jgi:hypothetical protein
MSAHCFGAGKIESYCRVLHTLPLLLGMKQWAYTMSHKPVSILGLAVSRPTVKKWNEHYCFRHAMAYLIPTWFRAWAYPHTHRSRP